MSVLITGGCGFIGSHLTGELLKRGEEVYVIDDTSSGSGVKIIRHIKSPHLHFIEGSILDEDKMKFLIKKCDIIFHFAAAVGVHLYVTKPREVLEVNVDGTKIVLDLAARFRRKVIMASTSEVYGKNPDVPWKENADRILGPTSIDRWVYSTSKAVDEHMCFAYQKSGGLSFVILRFFNIYGPWMDEPGSGRVVSIFVRQAIRNQPITIIGDGVQSRCFTYIDDAIKGIVLAGKKREALGKIFNIGIDKETAILELARLIKRLAASTSRIKFVDSKCIYGESYEDIPRRVPDVSKARRLLGFQASTRLEKGLKKTIEWFRDSCERG